MFLFSSLAVRQRSAYQFVFLAIFVTTRLSLFSSLMWHRLHLITVLYNTKDQNVTKTLKRSNFLLLHYCIY